MARTDEGPKDEWPKVDTFLSNRGAAVHGENEATTRLCLEVGNAENGSRKLVLVDRVGWLDVQGS